MGTIGGPPLILGVKSTGPPLKITQARKGQRSLKPSKTHFFHTMESTEKSHAARK